MKKPTVKLSEIVENIEFTTDGAESFYNELTGEFYWWSSYSDEEYRDLDEEEGWLALPNEREADEYSMMSDFIDTVKNNRMRMQLEDALSGNRPFRRFKDALSGNVEEAWFAFRDIRYLMFARDWCVDNEIPYDESELPENLLEAEGEDETETGIFVGKTATAATTVTAQNTAKAVGSGSLDVFATPMMIALMERAACDCLANALEPGQTSVGTGISVAHTAASPIGAEITASATVIGIDRRKIMFEVAAQDATGSIGNGTHERFIVDSEKFTAKAQSRV